METEQQLRCGKAMANGRFVSYCRVSTVRQGALDLGLDAQQEAIRSYLNGGRWTLVAEVVEVESGKRDDRPKLAEALALCRVHKATLIIGKLDRLARNVAFVSNLMESGVDFTAVDFPQANRLTIHILVAVAEHEAAMISARTKAALAATKARGTKLRGFRGKTFTEADHAAAKQARQARAVARGADLAPIVHEMQAAGVTSLNGLAKALTERGIPAARGGSTWSASQVSRLLLVNA